VSAAGAALAASRLQGQQRQCEREHHLHLVPHRNQANFLDQVDFGPPSQKVGKTTSELSKLSRNPKSERKIVANQKPFNKLEPKVGFRECAIFL
jgi:hypothetical protein